MNYAKIYTCDISNGPGWRVSLFVSGCNNKCEGCFNPETWDFKYGQEFTEKTMMELMNYIGNPHIAGLSVLGGEPLDPENIETVAEICKTVKDLYPTKSIWLWTGYDFIEDGLINHRIMQYIDVLVDGRFKESLKDLKLKYAGSSNQRIIDVSKSLEHGCAIRWGD
jgi:anaerobic ribonucleoside-triphosphate reductase activating protein